MRVVVTGANGHVGFHVAKAMRARGHQVRATVRSLDPGRTGRLAAAGLTDLAGLDICDPAAFDAAVAGADCLIHVAATYAYQTGGPAGDAAMIRDSVEGAGNAIRAAASAGLGKVVLTSSVVTLPLIRPGEAPVDESQWRTDLAIPYFRAKTEAERAAWTLAGDLGVPLATILPGAVGGGGFDRRTATTDILEGIMLGTMRFGAPRTNFPYVDVRDVAEAHALAAERPVTGRFIVVNDRLPSFVELVRLMHQIDPEIPPARGQMRPFEERFIPFADWAMSHLIGSPRVMTTALAEALSGRLWGPTNGRAVAELGWRQAVPIEDSLRDLVAALRAIRRREGRRRLA